MAGETVKVRESGSVVKWNDFDVFGFIQRDKDPRGRQAFIHVSQSGQRLEPGTRVSYVLEYHARGPRVVEVQLEDSGG
jgi:cold shock CspA family protein